VSNAIISQSKLAFWQDCLDKPSTPHHPVAQELHRARSRHKLSKAFLQRLVSSRRAQIEKPGHDTLAELEQYAEDTVSPILYMALQTTGAKTIHVISPFFYF
jgi:NADH dehydrogenase [ubiquinone] 1 alpha subcomplex assembly factor 6